MNNQGTDVPNGGRGVEPGWLARATDFIDTHYRQRIGRVKLAALAGVHEAHLASVFRRTHGVTIGEYVRLRRTAWAAERLAGTDTSIAVIAYEAGFADQAHLTRWFRRFHGETPAAYRRARQRESIPLTRCA